MGFSLSDLAVALMVSVLAALAAEQSAMAAPASGAGSAANPDPVEESLDDAWWTGPLLASTAATLPEGHAYVEPYLFDSLPYARFDGAGHSHAVPHQNDFGSLSYLNYGVADPLTIGLIPRFDYDWAEDGQSSSGIGVGDPSVQMQYRLTQFQPGSWIPTSSINVQESLPLGRYDRLEGASDGFGSGAWTTTFGLYLQSLYWLPNGRILRVRLDLSYALPSGVQVEGQSVYGTAIGFSGHASRGNSTFADLAFEYSITRNWVPALDIWVERDGNTRVLGTNRQSDARDSTFAADSGTGRELIVAPALEYNWSARAGIIFGARITAAGRNETAYVTPVAAFSYFL